MQRWFRGRDSTTNSSAKPICGNKGCWGKKARRLGKKRRHSSSQGPTVSAFRRRQRSLARGIAPVLRHCGIFLRMKPTMILKRRKSDNEKWFGVPCDRVRCDEERQVTRPNLSTVVLKNGQSPRGNCSANRDLNLFSAEPFSELHKSYDLNVHGQKSDPSCARMS